MIHENLFGRGNVGLIYLLCQLPGFVTETADIVFPCNAAE